MESIIYIYVFRMGKVVGCDPYGFPSREICIYFSWKAKYGDKLAIISAYPFSRCYHDFLKSRRLGICQLPNSFYLFHAFIYFLVICLFSLKVERSEKVCFRCVFPGRVSSQDQVVLAYKTEFIYRLFTNTYSN